MDGRIDVLINNAGSNRINKPPEETSLAEWKSVIDTNITGTFLCSREAGKVMIPIEKLGGLEELCGFLLYLATNKTGYMNGTTIPMDGGYSLW